MARLLGVLLALTLALLALLAGPAAAHDTLPPGIDWIDGDVDRALAEARAANKPLFLYWGAVWCPPCNQVKVVLFRRASFQNRLRAFVPVYLDGDAEAAQRWGDRFQVVGYPTLLVLRPDGSELMRIPGEADADRVVRMLDQALEAGHPLGEILERFHAGRPLDAGDWQLLATYGWELGSPVPDAELTALLARLARQAPAEPAGTAGRLWLHALATLVPASLPWDAEGAATALTTVLESRALARDSRDLLIQPPSKALQALAPLPAAELTRLRQAWQAALQTLVADSAISCTERLALAVSEVDLALAGQAPSAERLGAARLDTVHRLVRECDGGTRDELERQSVISAASDLLQAAGLDQEAATLLEAEVPRAHVPAYFMQERAALARRRGDGPDAIEWSGLSYAHANGGATRLQWAVRHVSDRIRFAPERHAAISDLGAVILREASALPDAFADRNLRSLRQLHGLLDDWARQQTLPAAESERLAAAWSALCRKVPSAGATRPAFCAAAGTGS